MGLLHPELSLDVMPTFVPKTIGDFLRDVSMIGNVSDRVSKFNEFVKRLEEEKGKIDAFKRELPLCMFLLNDAILALKEKYSQVAGQDNQPLLELFSNTESHNNEETEKEKDCGDKMNWMNSVQLWNSDDYPTSKYETKRNEEGSHSTTKSSIQSSRYKNGGKSLFSSKAYTSFLPEIPVRKEDKEQLTFRDLSLFKQGIKHSKEESNSNGTRPSSSKAMSSATANVPSSSLTGQQQHTSRKPRRCWSPELHHRFMNALEQIGGSQVATPKQIRELMRVDGLTNDEVKSHLQKYRLHNRKVSASDPGNCSVVVLEGLYKSQDGYSESSKGISQSGSPQGPLYLTGNGVTSTTVGDSIEDDDAKSESFSWKSHFQKPGKYDE